MRCLFVTHYFPPETGAAPSRLSDWARRLAAWGHQVTVVAPVPNYPRGRIFPEYRDRFFYEERVGNLRVLRTRIYVNPTGGFVQRIVSYFSFVFCSILVGIVKVSRQDVVLVESPPLFLGLSGLVLKTCLRAKMVFNVSDLWPETAVAMGILRNRFLIQLSVGLEEFLYRQSCLVTAQTQYIVADISRRVKVPVALITNGVDLEVFSDAELVKREVQRETFNFSDKFVVGYTGLFGMAQDLDLVLDAAVLLRNVPDVLFALFGDGPERGRLHAEVQRRHLDNVRFFAPQPSHTMPALMAGFDAAVVPLKRFDLFKGALPCKLFECMAAGTVVLVAIAGEAQQLVEDAEGGICIPPEDAASLVDSILRLRADPSLQRRLASNARSYITLHFDRKQIAMRLQGLLVKAAGVPEQALTYENRHGCRSASTIR